VIAAVMGDIHSNYVALEACLEDAQVSGAECFVFLGDFVSDLTDPRRTMDLIYATMEMYPCYAVRGNREAYMLAAREDPSAFLPGSKSGSLLYTFRNLREKDLAFFESLPIYDQICIGDCPVEIAHAEQDTDRHVFLPDGEHIAHVFDHMTTQLLLTGHSHLQYIRRREGKTILNPGALGMALGKPGHAQYALAEISPAGISARLLKIPYDVPRVIRETWESDLAAVAGFWPVGALNNVITGENRTIALLRRAEALGGTALEENWARAVRELGYPGTREEMLAFWENIHAG